MKMSGRASQKEHCFLGTPYGDFFLSILLFFFKFEIIRSTTII